MVASIGEPLLLSSYDNHRRGSPTAPLQSVYMSHERARGSRSKEGFATVTVHGDGVHVFDVRPPTSSVVDIEEPLTLVQLSDQHISGSYTLGPATTFAGPSVSRIVEENGTKSRRIYAVIEQSTGVRREDHGRTVWMWDDKQASENSGGTQEKKSSITVRL